MLDDVQGWVWGDRNYWSPKLTEQLHAQYLFLLAPFRNTSSEIQPRPTWFKHMHYKIEIVIGQLVERYHARRVWARDAWRLYSRWLSMILSHTVAVLFCQQTGHLLLRFSQLICD